MHYHAYEWKIFINRVYSVILYKKPARFSTVLHNFLLNYLKIRYLNVIIYL